MGATSSRRWVAPTLRIREAGWSRPWAAAFRFRSRLEAAALAAMLLLPLAMFHARAGADMLICAIDLMFLAHCAGTGDWRWLRTPWVAIAAAFWVWLTLMTLPTGEPATIAQAVVAVRLLLLVAAAQFWLLRAPDARTLLAWVVLALTLWLIEQTWQQLLLGFNMVGDPRHSDGALSGPFVKPRAGQVFLAVLFPALLPWVLRLLDRPERRARAAAGLILLAAIATMLVIGQRMPALLMGFGLVVAGLLAPRLRLPLLAALVAGAAVVALLPLLSPPSFDRLVLHFSAQMEHFWRDPYGQIYLRAAAMLRQHPWTGLGFEGFRHHCGEARYFRGEAWLGVGEGAISPADGCNIHPHNYWLEVATDAGSPGLLLFAALALLWLRGTARGLPVTAQPQRAALLVALAVAFWPLAAHSSLFIVDAGGFVFLFAGWALAAATEPATAAAPA